MGGKEAQGRVRLSLLGGRGRAESAGSDEGVGGGSFGAEMVDLGGWLLGLSWPCVAASVCGGEGVLNWGGEGRGVDLAGQSCELLRASSLEIPTHLFFLPGYAEGGQWACMRDGV